MARLLPPTPPPPSPNGCAGEDEEVIERLDKLASKSSTSCGV